MPESFLQARARKERASRGKSTEGAVWSVFKEWMDNPEFVAERIPDGRSAGRPGAAVTCDYNVWYRGVSYAVEVKRVASGFRLKKFAQYPRMRRRQKAGCHGLVVIHFEQLGWFCVTLGWLENNLKGASWDFKDMESCRTAKEALSQYF